MFWRLKTAARDLVTRPVVASPAGALHLERGDLGWLTSAGKNSGKIAVVASWADHPEMSLSLSRYLFELDEAGYVPFVVSTAPIRASLQWPHGLPARTVVARRRNVGYDFGSWAAALHAVPEIAGAAVALLTNDSLVGPFWSMRDVFAAVERADADVVAATDSLQMGHTVQSYFVAFKRGILGEAPWRRFFARIRPQPQKMDVVYQYEAALARKCTRAGYSWTALYSARTLGAGKTNPTISCWQELFEAGFPLVKRTLFADPAVSWQVSQQGRWARAYLVDRHRIDVDDWLPKAGANLADALGGSSPEERSLTGPQSVGLQRSGA